MDKSTVVGGAGQAIGRESLGDDGHMALLIGNSSQCIDVGLVSVSLDLFKFIHTSTPHLPPPLARHQHGSPPQTPSLHQHRRLFTVTRDICTCTYFISDKNPSSPLLVAVTCT